MKTTSKLTAAVAAGVGIATALAFSPSAQALRSEDASLSTTQIVAMYEEERLAGDVYDNLADRFGSRIFVTIGNAEEQHQSEVASLLESRGYDVQSLPAEPGDYVTDGYAEAYDDLVRRGGASLASAYQVGIDIEKMDIADLDGLLAATTDPVQTRVLMILRNGSQHHLAAFSGGDQGEGPATGPGNGQGPGSRMGNGRVPGQGNQGRGGCAESVAGSPA